MKHSAEEINQLLQDAASGDSVASESLFPIVYDELHRLASSYMQRERKNHTLQPTALIHEAYLRLTKPATYSAEPETKAEIGPGQYRDFDHFMATAAVVMRRILVNHANAKKAKKRGEGKVNLPLGDVATAFEDSAIDLIALDEALKVLATVDETQHKLVELRFFGGLTNKQCAKILGVSERNVYYEWAHARAWLKNQIEKGES